MNQIIKQVAGTLTLTAANFTNDGPREDIFILCNSTAGAITINLPQLSTLPFLNARLTVCDVAGTAGTNAITIVRDTTTPDRINGQTASIVINTNYGSAKLQPASQANWMGDISLGSGAGIATVIASASQASFATDIFTAFPVGKMVCIQDYTGTGDAGTFQRTSNAANTFADWIVIATENPASTGAIGSNPA